jgi:hypothetical protein
MVKVAKLTDKPTAFGPKSVASETEMITDAHDHPLYSISNSALRYSRGKLLSHQLIYHRTRMGTSHRSQVFFFGPLKQSTADP